MHQKLFVHVVWTTANRDRSLDSECAATLCVLLREIAEAERVGVLGIGIVSTHLHLILQIHPTTGIPRLLQRLKGASACSINRYRTNRLPIRWAKGYSISSVSERSLGLALEYVARQHLHHPGDAIEGWPPSNGDYD